MPPFYNFTGNYKPSGQDRTVAERNYVIEATRCRRRILQAGVLLTLRWIEVQLIFDILETNMEKSCTITIVEKKQQMK